MSRYPASRSGEGSVPSVAAIAGATNLTLVTFLIPVGAILLGTAALGEQLQLRHLIGMGLVAVGLAAIDGRLVNFRKRCAA